MPDLNQYLAAHQRGDAAEAERGYRLLMASDTQQASAARRLLGALLLQQARDSEALELLDAAVNEQPGDAEARTNLAIALRRNGRLTEAAAQARIAVDAAPERPAAWNALGLSLLDLGEFEPAAQIFQQAIERHPNVAAFLLHLGQARSAAQDLAGAEAAFLAALGISQEIAEAWRGLGRLQARQARYREAIAAYQRAAALIGPQPDFAIEFGAALCAAGMHEQGQTLLRAALQALPENPEGWYWLGRSQLSQGRPAEAADALARAASLAPDNAVVRHLLAATRGEVADSVDSDYVRALYEDFAERFEVTLVDSLGYSVPDQLAEMIRRQTGLEQARVLDLGCGTGLMAAPLAGICAHLEGVDLSPRMLKQAAAKGAYAALHEAEIGYFLLHNDSTWDLVVIADVVIYMGKLDALFDAVLGRLRPGGWLALSAEAAQVQDIEIDTATARHRHGRDYLQRSLHEAGFGSVSVQNTSIRRERGRETPGYLVLAQRPAE